MSNRRKIRETVLQAFYAAQIGDNPPEQVIQRIIKTEIVDDPAGLAFAERLFLRALDQSDQTDDIIRAHIANWEIDRLALLDRLILQLAITELIAFEDIPAKVTINEAIEIAKKFSTAKSGRFVNGILDAAFLSLGKENLLRKEGRGLVDQPARKPKSKRDQPKDEIPDATSDKTTHSETGATPGSESLSSLNSDPNTAPNAESNASGNAMPESGGKSESGSQSKPLRKKKKRIKRR